MKETIIGLLNNASLLLAFGLIYDIIYRKGRTAGSTMYQVASGLFIGSMAMLLMFNPVKWEASIIFDTRTILLSVASLFFGTVPALIAMVIASVYRLSLGGSGAIPGVATIVSACLIGIFWRHYRFNRVKELSLAELYLFGIIVHLAMLLCLLFLPRELVQRFFGTLALPVIVIYPVATALLGSLLANRQKRLLLEEELQNSQNEFKAIANYAASWEAWFNPDGKLQWMNPFSEKLTGYTPAEYIAADNIISMVIAEDYRVMCLEKFKEALQGSCGDNLEFICLRKDGSRFWASVSWQPILDADGRSLGFRTSAQDITERKRIEETLRQSEEKFSTAFDAIPLLIAINTLEDATYLDVNKKFCTLTGFSRDETIGKTPFDLGIMPPEDIRRLQQEVQQHRHIAGIEITLSTKEKNPVTAVFYGELITIDNTQHMLSIALDVTEHRQLEAQLRQSQKMEAIGQLAGGVAHDFNNILSVIMGYGSLLKTKSILSTAQLESLDQILAAADKAAQLTSGLLAFSRKQTLSPKTVNLNDIIQHVQKFLVRVIGEDIHLRTVTNEGDLPVNVDCGQIEQVLINLATNARDAMQKGGMLTIETSLQTVNTASTNTPEHAPAGAYAVIAVTDTGCGMNEAVRQKIFEPFFTTKEIGKGTGLGMAIVYGIIKQHNGFIYLFSEPGKGTTFRIYLPIIEREPAVTAEHAAPAPPEGGNETILLAEDDPAVRNLMERVLTDYGYKVLLAVDGKEAVAAFTANHDRIQLTVMDMIMPKLNGQAAAEEIRKQQPNARVLFTSGYTADFIRDRGVNDDKMELIMKPVKLLELLRKVREILDR